MFALAFNSNGLLRAARRVPFPVALAVWTAALASQAWTFHAQAPMAVVLALALVASLAYLVLLVWMWEDGRSRSGRLVSLVVCAVGVRLLLIFAPPVLSDDIFRYLWEGRVIVSGQNPFALAPDSPGLAHLRGPLWEFINYPEISAIYPPLAQAMFALVALFGGSVGLMKLVFTGVELAAAGVLWKWLARARLPGGRIAVWLLHPLVVLEVAGNGHLDALLVLGLAMTFLGTETPTRHRAWLAALGLTVATLAKLVPLVALPHLARCYPRRAWGLFLAVPVIVALSYTPFLGAGDGLFRALDSYESRWRHNDSLFGAVLWGAEQFDPDGEVFRALAGDISQRLLQRHPDSVPGDPNQVEARIVIYVVFAALWLAVLWKGGPWDRQWLWLFGGALLLSPVNHPWYLMMLIPCSMRRFQPAVLWWSLSILATYLALGGYWETGIWDESAFAWWLQYGGLAVIGAITLVRSRRASPTA